MNREELLQLAMNANLMGKTLSTSAIEIGNRMKANCDTVHNIIVQLRQGKSVTSHDLERLNNYMRDDGKLENLMVVIAMLEKITRVNDESNTDSKPETCDFSDLQEILNRGK